MTAFFTVAAHAGEIENEQLETLGGDMISDAVPDSAQLDGMEITDALDSENTFRSLFERAKGGLTDALLAGAKSALAVVSVAAICSLGGAIFPDGGEINYAELAGVIAIASLSAAGFKSYISEAQTVMSDMNAFSKALLPTLAAAASASGAVTSSAVKFAASALFADIFITVTSDIVMPLIYALFAVSVCSCAVGSAALDKVAGAIKKAIKLILTVIALAFTVYVSLSGIVSETADAAAVKVTKSVVSSALPVVGGMISDAAGAVLAGISTLKSAIGIFGVTVICATCITPFLHLGAGFLIYKAAAMFAECVAGARVSKMTDAIASVYAAILGTIGADAIVIFFAIISLVRTVSG
ncbi:MAG: hypothetical protein IKI49_05195 [Oscillospiraceae bacterium]|nr:hypothetical protein [Oscillospiraceae bacterium]